MKKRMKNTIQISLAIYGLVLSIVGVVMFFGWLLEKHPNLVAFAFIVFFAIAIPVAVYLGCLVNEDETEVTE